MLEILEEAGVISYILGILEAACVAFIVKQYKETQALKSGMQSLLRASMISEYNNWSEKGYAPIYVKQSFESNWINYEALGKNGVMKGVHDDFMNLPNEKIISKEN